LTLLEQDDLTAISDLSFADEVTSESEQLVFLHFLISKLPERRQLVFKMHRIEGFSYAEIAELLQISVRTVEDHLSKSMQFIYDQSQHLIHRKLTEA
jgi:RNA polymerase sigma-70 factor (ECF subfamily)